MRSTWEWMRDVEYGHAIDGQKFVMIGHNVATQCSAAASFGRHRCADWIACYGAAIRTNRTLVTRLPFS